MSGRRGSFPAGELAQAATVAGHACLGWPAAGEIAPGAFAELVKVALDTPRLAGASSGQLSMSSTNVPTARTTSRAARLDMANAM